MIPVPIPQDKQGRDYQMSPKFVDPKHLRHVNGQGRETSTSPIDGNPRLRSEPEELIALYKPA
jgi:hypothetical protein